MLSLVISFMAILGMSAQGFVKFRLEAGPTFNFNALKMEKISLSRKGMTGYHVGLFVDVPLSKSGFYMGSGIKVAMKGFNGYNSFADFIEIKTSLHYMEIPLNIGHTLTLSKAVAISLQATPYYAFALSGTLSVQDVNTKLDQKINLFKGNITENLKNSFRASRHDIGLELSARIHISSYYVVGGVDFGLLNVFDKEGKLNNKMPKINFTNGLCYLGAGVSF